MAIEDADEGAFSRPPTQEDHLRYDDLLQALEALPDDQRAALVLVTVEDLSYAEAATVLGVPVGTVMSRLARARERLRVALGESERASRGPNLRRVK